MDVWEATRVILRRWFVVVPILVLTSLFATEMAGRAQPEYSATATVVMLAPFRTNGETGTVLSNPYLTFGTSLTTTAQILQASLDRSEVRGLLANEGLAPNYNVIPQERSPLVDITVKTDDSKKAIDTVNRVVQLLQDDLRARQAALKTPRDQVITTQVLALASGSTLYNSGRARIRYLVFGLGLFLSALAAFATEGFLRWAGRRKSQQIAAEAVRSRVQPGVRPAAAEAERVESAR